jgi:RNA polymerase sigma factor (sigma-70 family)
VPDDRVAAAVANWAPRFVAQGVDANDFTRTTGRIERWDEWLDAWTETAQEHEALAREARQLIERAIDALPPDYRRVFVLADVEGWPNADIAAHLGLSLPATKSRLHRARLLLRDTLAPHFEEIVA